MFSSELAFPVPMRRVAIVAPRDSLRDALVQVAGSGVVELVGTPPPAQGEEVEALRRLEHTGAGGAGQPARLAASRVDTRRLAGLGERGLLAGEVELQRRAALARPHGSFAVLLGWIPVREAGALAERLQPSGAGLVELPRPAWVDPPTAFAQTTVRRWFRPLVTTYGVARYADVDVTPFAAASFVIMFGMMFGDLGHGLVLAGLGGLLARARGRFAAYRSLWPFLVACGLASAAFGCLYGEAFGPTGLAPRLWLDPIQRPGPMLVAAIVVGAVLLAISHLYGALNRWREDGPRSALVSQTGIAGLGVLAGIGICALSWWAGSPAGEAAGAVVMAAGVVLLAAGFAAGAGVGRVQAGVELIDALVRIASNLLSFTRLAAFGLMHAALGAVIVDAAGALWGGPVGAPAAAVVFVAGNVLAFSLELLVTGVQALRLEFYELFSRIFTGEGHPFAPWSLPVTEEVP